MRILALSDLHFGKPGWGTFSRDKIAAAIEQAEKFRPDVLYFGGDLADWDEQGSSRHFDEGVEALRSIPIPNKIWVAGNHCIEFVEGDSIYDYAELLQKYVGDDFHVLDVEPFYFHEGPGNDSSTTVAFVGNIGWHDGSFWRKPDHVDPSWPSTREDVRQAEIDYFKKTLGEQYKDVKSGKVTNTDFYQFCRNRRIEHLESILGQGFYGADRIIACTHYTPSPDFLLGGTAKFEYLNWYMGFDGRDHTEYNNLDYVVMGLCGHTHRAHTARVGTTLVQNVSGPQQPFIIDL